jgi:hypothetical protein
MAEMAKRRYRLTSGAVAVAFLATAMLFGAHVASGARNSVRMIQVLSKTTNERVLKDSAPKGESKGDVIVGSSVLRNAVAQFGKPRGVLVGRDQYRIVVETPNIAAIRVTVRLPGGTFTCRGRLFHNRTRQVLQAVSGAGTFAHATGLCTATSAPKNRYGANALNVYMLQIPG